MTTSDPTREFRNTAAEYGPEIAEQFKHLGTSIAAIHQGIMNLAAAVARVEALRDDFANPDTYQGELLDPHMVAHRIGAALAGTPENHDHAPRGDHLT